MTKGFYIKRLIPTFILVVLLLSTLFLWYTVRSNTFLQYQKNFEFAAQEAAVLYQLELEERINILYGARGLFEASDFVDREGWQRYIQSLKIDERFSGIQAIEYIERVGEVEKDEFIESVRNDTLLVSDGYPYFSIYPDIATIEYFIVNYIEPFEGNESAFGFNLASSPERLESLQKARDINDFVATKPITLVQEQGSQSGFLVFLPLYDNKEKIDTVEERREGLKGYVLAVFRIEDLSREILRETSVSESLAIEMRDGITGEILVDMIEDTNNGLTIEIPVKVADREWIIRFAEKNNFFGQSYSNIFASLILFMGLLFSVLIFFLLYMYNNRREDAVRLAHMMTNDLRLRTEENEKFRGDLEKINKELEKKAKKLTQKIEEIEKINKLMVNRELEMIKMKKMLKKTKKK